ncbi:hypothetical protein ACVWZZ_005935 [Bradyrhizobium sp. LM6.10]
MAALIMTARLNNIDPKVWLADVFARIADMPQSCLRELLPWNWTSPRRRQSWSRLSEQNLRVDKWSVCRG